MTALEQIEHDAETIHPRTCLVVREWFGSSPDDRLATVLVQRDDLENMTGEGKTIEEAAAKVAEKMHL